MARRTKLLLAVFAALLVIAPIFWFSRGDDEEFDDAQPSAIQAGALLSGALIDWSIEPPAPPPFQPPAHIQSACGSCHLVPPPQILPQGDWDRQVQRMYDMARMSSVPMTVSRDLVLSWYEQNAPATLPEAPRRGDASFGAAMAQWQMIPWKPDPAPPVDNPLVSFLGFISLADGARPHLIMSELGYNQVLAIDPLGPPGNAMRLATLKAPCRVEPCDLDGDGQLDLVVAELGQFTPTDDLLGRITWLRRLGPGTFHPITLLENIPRVADVRPADLDGDGDLDLVVAVFGWMKTGHVMWMENLGSAGSLPGQPPLFRQHILDPRPGAIHVPVLDFDGDGDLDIIALISQHHEQVMLYRKGPDGYKAEVLYQAPHPDWGFTGMQPIDIDADGDLDFVLSNGDALDSYIVKPFHGVGLLENRGAAGMKHHQLTAMYGAHRAVTADYDADGDLDIMAVAYVPHDLIATEGANVRLEGLVYLERVGPTQFRRHLLLPDRPDFSTAAAGDVDGDGRPEFTAGAMRTAAEEVYWDLPFWAVLGANVPAAPQVIDLPPGR